MGRVAVENALRRLTQVPFFADETNKILTNPVFQSDSSVHAFNDVQAMVVTIDRLRDRVHLVRNFLRSSLPKSSGSYLAVALPPEPLRSEDASRYLQRLHLALDQPVRRLGHPPFNVQLDVGSNWVEFATSSASALGVIGVLLTLAVGRAKLDHQRLKNEQERAKLEQERLKVAQETAKASQETDKAEQERYKLEAARLDYEVKHAIKRAELAQLETELRIQEFVRTSNEPAETSNVLMRAVDELTELYSEGAKFSLQYDAPAEMREAFPMEALPSTAHNPKLLPASGTKAS